MTTEKDNLNCDGQFTLDEWVAAPIAPFDRYAQYMEEVEPLTTALQAKCRELELPFSFVVVHTQRPNGDTAIANGMTVPHDLGRVPGDVLAANEAANGNPAKVLGIFAAESARLRAARATGEAISGCMDA